MIWPFKKLRVNEQEILLHDTQYIVRVLRHNELYGTWYSVVLGCWQVKVAYIKTVCFVRTIIKDQVCPYQSTLYFSRRSPGGDHSPHLPSLHPTIVICRIDSFDLKKNYHMHVTWITCRPLPVTTSVPVTMPQTSLAGSTPWLQKYPKIINSHRDISWPYG